MSEFQLGFIAFLNEYYALSTGRLGYNRIAPHPLGISSKPVMVLQPYGILHNCSAEPWVVPWFLHL